MGYFPSSPVSAVFAWSLFYDQGTELKKKFAELLASYGIEGVPTTTRNPQANAVIERLHHVIDDKMITQTIETATDWEIFRDLCSSRNPPQYARCVASDMIAGIANRTDWTEQCQRKLDQVIRHNKREKGKREEWVYSPGDRVLLNYDGGVESKTAPIYSGLYEMIAVRENGTLVLNKGRYIEMVFIRRVQVAA
ncbi:hypothetical protein GN958_ATG21601 [Phytophthora infestans]|uniref:Integrase catalytic domain-containing protein n=1 Tax=Phytophthora infestans TaxID=4787 RepID=A0A8S9TQY8_PHYIN|nr:hypothetical protein GN958_ATG21601 [Phytophthora infestans]